MIHIALNHWDTPDWLRTQVSYIRRFTAVRARLVACVEAIPSGQIADVDVVVEGIGGNHAGKLNLLGHRILADANDDDTVVFLGATMLPLAHDWLRPASPTAALTTVTDRQFYPELQPHPIFCATTVELWRRLPGDWAPGFESMPGRVPSTMAGANLVDRLRHAGVDWSAHEASPVDPANPVSFARFGPALYHHGSLPRRLAANGFEQTAARSISTNIAARLHAGEELFGAELPGKARE